jgi:hypothetical protein
MRTLFLIDRRRIFACNSQTFFFYGSIYKMLECLNMPFEVLTNLAGKAFAEKRKLY